ncbi:MAG: hypothetical protein KDC87_10095 [Planctomycetes bacterium]|nr:hypothetical protein [Planctomycetota bacterium]MCB9870671.1 hypothetical protein [Planctomycetota bacterium]MCB9888668.1 hypothetical protein [Planctomycetota bacterium]MCB9889979.1 hypothetical protein [Planctomycetota bacterium]
MKRGNWSTHELERLRSLFPRSSQERVARLLRRSVASVRRKAQEIFGEHARHLTRPWSADDDRRLREGHGVVESESLSLVLGRTEEDIELRIEQLRAAVVAGRRWSRAERGVLRRFYGSRTDEDLVVCIGRPVDEIRGEARRMCLSKDKGFLAHAPQVADRAVMPRWTSEEIRVLRERYARSANLELARLLSRSVASIANKANQLGLKKAQDVLQEMGRQNVAGRWAGS